MRLPPWLAGPLLVARIRTLWFLCLLLTNIRLALTLVIFGVIYGWAIASDADHIVVLMLAATLVASFLGIALRPPKLGTAIPPALVEPLERQPQFLAEVRAIACDFGAAPPAGLAPVLGVQFQRWLDLDRDRHRDLALPVPCLGVWSVLELRCHAAHFMVRPRTPFRSAEAGINLLALESASYARTAPVRRLLDPVVQRIARDIASWHLLADIQADLNVARHYGADSVASWIEKSWQAHASTAILAGLIGPAIAIETRIPIAESYASLQEFTSPQWDAALRSNTPSPYRTRLDTLRSAVLPSGAFDSRAATALFPNLDDLEERVLRCEFRIRPGVKPRRIALSEFGDTVLVPYARSEVSRNGRLLEGRTPEDLPDLALRLRELAALYVPPPSLLPDKARREAMTQQLLVWFLTVGLLDRGWTLSPESWAGPRLAHGQRVINPQEAVGELVKQTLAADSFRVQIG